MSIFPSGQQPNSGIFSSISSKQGSIFPVAQTTAPNNTPLFGVQAPGPKQQMNSAGVFGMQSNPSQPGIFGSMSSNTSAPKPAISSSGLFGAIQSNSQQIAAQPTTSASHATIAFKQ